MTLTLKYIKEQCLTKLVIGKLPDIDPKILARMAIEKVIVKNSDSYKKLDIKTQEAFIEYTYTLLEALISHHQAYLKTVLQL